MNADTQHTTLPFSTAWKSLFLVVMLFCLALPAMAQNTKGDRPSSSGGGRRESRFKSPFKKKKSKTPTYGRAKSRGPSRANSGRRQPGNGRPKVYPQQTASSPNNRQRAWRGDISGTKLRTRTSQGSARNVYPQYGRYNSNPSRKPRNTQRTVSNRGTLARLNRMQSGPQGSPPRRRKIVPRSASRSFTARRSTNVYASFPKPKRRVVQGSNKDLAGRRLRSKNFETRRPEIAPSYSPYSGKRRRVGDSPYRGPAAGNYRSATRTKPQAWTGDIAGRRIRGRNFSSKRRVEGTPILSGNVRTRSGRNRGVTTAGGYRTRSGKNRMSTSPLARRAPGIGADGIGGFRGRLRQGRPLKGGGSVSGRLWNNRQSAVVGRPPSGNSLRISGFSGNIKGRKGFSDEVGGYSGNIKRQRPLKGGGSVSGKLWNNGQSAVAGRAPSGNSLRMSSFSGNIKGRKGFSDEVGGYAGNIKRQRPLKGGGSVSGKLWNNNESSVLGRGPSGNARRMSGFAGTLKGRAPLKGGGSVSTMWNNKEKPLQKRVTAPWAIRIGGFKGNQKRFEQSPGFGDQGGEFTGYIRRPKFWKDYRRNPNAHEDAPKKKYPDDVYQAGGLQIAVKQRPHGRRKNAVEGTLDGLTPSAATTKASAYARGVRKTWKYIHNGSSAKEALKVREPGKAYARSADYQGNIKMSKFALFEKRNKHLHPDAQFVKINKNNVDGERDMLTNFKLWWGRLFRKEETQPDHLKDKGHKPRYDKGEEGLWYE